MRKRNATTSDTSQIPQMPLPARRIAPTSRMTHRHPTNTPTGKRPLHEPHNAPDGQYGTTNGTRQRDASACRHDDETLRRNAACLLADTTTERRTPRRIATRPTTRRHGTTDGTRKTGSEAGREAGRKKRAAIRKEKRPEKRNEIYAIKRNAANYLPSETASSSKRGKSRRRER